MMGFEQVAADLRDIFNCFPLTCLEHVRDNRHRLTRWNYATHDGKGCMMNLLSETLPREQRIYSKESLMRFFRNFWQPGRDCAQDTDYQPAKWIVRLWDGHICDQLRQRYGDCTHLSDDQMFGVLNQVIDDRRAIEREAKAVEDQAAARLREQHGVMV